MNTPFSPVVIPLPLSYLLWGVVGVALIVFAIFSAILAWHWYAYSTGRYTTFANLTLYVLVGMGLLMVMAGTALSYTFL